MSGSQGICKTLGRTLAAVVVAGMLVSTAPASLTIHITPDLGLPPNTPPPEFGGMVPYDPLAPAPVQMQIWAVVTDGNGDPSDDGLWKFYSALRSSTGGLALGDLEASTAFGFFGEGASWIGNGASLGAQADLDGDGDLDVGDTDVTQPAPPWFAVRHAFGMQFNNSPFGGAPTTMWNVANLTFIPGAPGPEFNPAGPSGVTEIWADPRQFEAANWVEDGLPKINYIDPGAPNRGELESGEKVVLYVASTAKAPGGGAPVVLGPGGPAVVLDGTASTGSINWWSWDFDGDGTPEIEGVGEGVQAVTYEDLTGPPYDIPDGVYTATMTVGWSESPVVNTDTATFPLELVPEPATIALLVGGCLMTLRRRR